MVPYHYYTEGTIVKVQTLQLDELMRNYEAALGAAGYGYSTRLRMLSRAGRLVNQHEEAGCFVLNEDVVTGYFRDNDQSLYEGKISPKRWREYERDVRRFLGFAETGVTDMPYLLKGSRYIPKPEFQKIADAFLASENVTQNTQNDMRWIAHRYFVWLGEHGYENMTGVGAKQIQKFMLDCSEEMVPNSMHNVRLYLKKLYAFLYAENLSASAYDELLSFKVNREHKIYPILSRDDINKLLAAIDRKTKVGKRAYAVMLLGSELGLRACDVVGLKLGDIDWMRGEIKVIQSKTGNPVVLPLLENVGEALVDYILNARPKSDAPQAFLRLQKPHTPLKAAVTIGEIYRDCCIAAGIKSNKRFHTLRRSLATGMVTHGIDVHTVAQVLGDTDIESTKPYIALDSAHLKRCALPFDGIAPKGGGAA